MLLVLKKCQLYLKQLEIGRKCLGELTRVILDVLSLRLSYRFSFGQRGGRVISPTWALGVRDGQGGGGYDGRRESGEE